MSSLKRSNNLAARMGRWSARHRKIAIFGWLGLVVIAVLIGKAAGTTELKQNDAIPGESGRATRLIDAEFGPKASETVLVQSNTLTADDAAFRVAVGEVIRSVKSFAVVGDGGSAREVEGQFSKDLGKAGLLSLPVTLIILLITFGALFAAGIPLLLALTSVIATMFLIALPSHLMPVDAQVKEVILLIGLAVGVDYSLFYLKREREERAAGRSESAALEAAA